jgi:hypothetical protein
MHMRQPLLVSVAASVLMIGCGPSALRVRAEENVRTTAEAITEVRSSGGEAPAELTSALDEADLWLRRAERAVDTWEGERSFAYETVAPCLARSLADARTALTQAGRPVPESLDEAEAQAASAVDATCPRPATGTLTP